MEILLPCTMDFKVDMHLPVLEEARLQRKQRQLLRAPQAILPARCDPAQTRLLHWDWHSLKEGQAAGSQMPLINRHHTPQHSQQEGRGLLGLPGGEGRPLSVPRLPEAQTLPILALVFSWAWSQVLTLWFTFLNTSQTHQPFPLHPTTPAPKSCGRITTPILATYFTKKKTHSETK